MPKLDYSTVKPVAVDAVQVTDSIRKTMDDVALDELGKSMSEVGAIYPIVVRQTNGKHFDLVIGLRRLEAARRLKLGKIPALVVKDLDDREKFELALSENLHREDLTPFEEAWAIMKLVKDFKTPLGDVAKRIGRTSTFVRERMKLCAVPKEAQELVAKKQLTVQHVDTLASLGSPEDQLKFAREAAKHELSAKELATLIKEELKAKPTRKPQQQAHFTAKKVQMRLIAIAEWIERTTPRVIELPKAAQMVEVREGLQRLIKQAEKMREAIASVIRSKAHARA